MTKLSKGANSIQCTSNVKNKELTNKFVVATSHKYFDLNFASLYEFDKKLKTWQHGLLYSGPLTLMSAILFNTTKISPQSVHCMGIYG